MDLNTTDVFYFLSLQMGDTMALSGKGRIIHPSKGKLIIYVPSKVHNDSAFPFKSKQDVQITIEGNTLIVRGLK